MFRRRLGGDNSRGPSTGLVLGAVAVLLVVSGVAASGGSSASVGGGSLQRFAPQSSTRWWAIVASDRQAKSYVLRTTDGGKGWRRVAVPLSDIGASAFVGADAAWVEGS